MTTPDAMTRRRDVTPLHQAGETVGNDDDASGDDTDDDSDENPRRDARSSVTWQFAEYPRPP